MFFYSLERLLLGFKPRTHTFFRYTVVQLYDTVNVVIQYHSCRKNWKNKDLFFYILERLLLGFKLRTSTTVIWYDGAFSTNHGTVLSYQLQICTVIGLTRSIRPEFLSHRHIIVRLCYGKKANVLGFKIWSSHLLHHSFQPCLVK